MDTALNHEDAAVRRRAEEKALAWEAVLSGMATGTLEVGSRTPVANTPAWVTLEVAHGGFATGRYLAEGPLTDEERELLVSIPSDPDIDTDRLQLNRWFLGDAGLEVLTDGLRTRDYAVEVPEHAALLVVAWLISRGHEAEALDLVAELYPLIDRLRFYPSLREVTATSGAVVRLESVGEVSTRLRAATVPQPIAAMNETLTVWHPLYDRLVGLWSETVEEGWPCAVWPVDWSERRAAWLADHASAAAIHKESGEHARTRSTFAILRGALERCERDSSALNGRDVGRVRAALNRSIERWGPVDSRQQLRRAQEQQARRPTNRALAAVVVERLEPWPTDAGVADLEPVIEPIEIGGEQERMELPPAIVRKVQRALEAPIEELVERRIIPSSEVLARVLPQISSHVASASFRDSELRDLYSRIYAAFRRRRSLLLLNLEHQVSIDELPWVRSLEAFKTDSVDAQDAARDTLKHVTLLALTSFPQTIVPNPLLTEMSALAKQASLDVPLVEEVAADIFMGTFTRKWRRAAAIAARETEGSLYARYYSLPSASQWSELREPKSGNLVDRARERWGKPVADDFAAVCEARAKEAASGDGSWVARNGAIIEQSQILTTQNLAPLVAALELRDRLESRAPDLAGEAFRWIVRQQNTRWDHWRSELQMMKNTAYAWRQAIYFLSLADQTRQSASVAALRTLADEQPDGWRSRFDEAIVGLEAVIGGSSFDEDGRLEGGRRFLGWSVGPHWLFPPRERS